LLVLDTDHFSEWERRSQAGSRLRERLRSSGKEMAVTITTVEEQFRGWLAQINRLTEPARIIFPYSRLQQQVETFAEWLILPWDTESAVRFAELRRFGVRIGTLDLRIACIALAHDATLLTRNTRDFAQVPGLRFENWLA